MRSMILGIVAICLTTAGAVVAQDPVPTQLPEPDLPAPTPATKAMEQLPRPSEVGPQASEEKEESHPGGAEAWKPEKPGTIKEECHDVHPWDRFHFRAEYLLWWFRDMPTPPVLTTGLSTDMLPGALGQPGTVVLFGGKDLYEKHHSGSRFTADWWFDPQDVLGIEATGFFLTSRSVQYNRPTHGGIVPSIVGQPFLNLGTGQEDVSLITFPNVASGVINFNATTRMSGAEANGLANLFRWRGFRVDGLVGFRYFQFFESYTLGELSTLQDSVPVLGGSTTAGIDYFGVTNNFTGGQMGLRTEVRNGRLFVELQGKLALGNTQETIDIAGQTILARPGFALQALPGNLFALSSNIGRRTHNAFALLPEGNANFGWQPCDHLQFLIGYSFLYLSRVARAGAQIDRGLNPNLVPTSLFFGNPGGPARPAPLQTESDFWVQGFNFGFEILF